jgi:2-polyprenyl-3-methyl-5-hydroxy-6-metoxy-1,4-benzoquinol methylase
MIGKICESRKQHWTTYTMDSYTNKLKYFQTSALKTALRKGFDCPSCGEIRSAKMDGKWIVTALRRCSACKLLYRTPTTSAEENAEFYQTSYQQGFTTDLPSEKELKELLATRFADHEKNYHRYLQILTALGAKPGMKLFDYGCSWGYGSYQLAQAGFSVEAYEISKPRAEYARTKLNVSIQAPSALEYGVFDIFFSSHVIEHVPNVESMILSGMKYLRPGGLFIAFTPNGSKQFRDRSFASWHKLWGLVHPQLIDEEYLLSRFSSSPIMITSSVHSLEHISRWDRSSRPHVADLTGDELMFCVQK